MFQNSVFPDIWKTEFITPAAKVFPPCTLSDFHPVLLLYNGAKMSDKIISSYIVQDISKDVMQYGKEKGLSINHYLINEIVLFSGFEFCWQHSYDRSTLNLCWCCILHLPAQLPPSRPSPPWPGSPPTRTLPRSCRSGQGDE